MSKTLSPISLWALTLNLLVLLSCIGLILYHQASLPPAIPLWFSLPWGDGRLAQPQYIWLLPALVGIFLLVNNLLAKILYRKHRVLALILIWTGMIISLVIFFSVYRILLVVT